MKLFIRRIPYNIERIKWVIHGFFTGKGKCEYLGHGPCKGDVKRRNSMTAYHFEGVKDSKEDPNRRFMACKDHYDEYVDHWTDMWSNVPRG